jgi:fructoselysine-6-P-deglycase FrlB-like protein
LGKPYEIEMEQLAETYSWALTVESKPLSEALRRAASLPLLTVGSGGSFTAADFAAAAHREMTGHLATALTPLEAVASGLEFRSAAVLVTTAAGKNPDVLGSFKRIAEREPRRLGVLCLSLGSPLGRLASGIPCTDFIEFEPPAGKDGFLATNTLLASVVLLFRGYAEATGVPVSLPEDFKELLGGGPSDDRWRPLWGRDTLVILHGPATRPVAVDLESKFTESALGNVRSADYRHFAHGRHHWLAKHADSTAVLAFTMPDDEILAEKTLALLPAGVPVVRESIALGGLAAGVAALVRGLYVAGSAGRARGIDPGRPGVPGFGRRIYHLNAFRGARQESNVPADEAVAIERKAGRTIASLASASLLEPWRQAYQDFLSRLRKARLKGLVLDYDGTLCGENARFMGMPLEARREFTRLLRSGLALGVATGRGKSVKAALRDAIPKEHWGRVVVGYYNGGDIGLLGDDTCPDGSDRISESLRPVADAIAGHPLLGRFAQFEFRPPQIKAEPTTPGASADWVWELLQQVVLSHAGASVRVLRSSHSMDVLAPGVDKRAVVARVTELLGEKTPDAILCVGDRGRYPGNDFLLLSHPLALSVDEVSPDPTTCWNIAPAGVRCAGACLEYLCRVRAANGGAHFTV